MSFIDEADGDVGGSTDSEAGSTDLESGSTGLEPGGTGPEPGTPENPLQITDPRAMRALAHPARIAILYHLALEGPATATECAEVAGLSPSACSYHLRALARYGFVEEERSGAADGRHRPWRARVVAISVGDGPDRPEAVRAAGRLLLESIQARVEEVRADYRDREASYPRDWQLAAGMNLDVLHVTPDELVKVKTAMQEMLTGYRRLRPQDRPANARLVHVLMDFTPGFDPKAGPPAGQASEQDIPADEADETPEPAGE